MTADKLHNALSGFVLVLVTLLASSQEVTASAKLKIKVDARIELIAIIQILYKDYPVVTPYESTYKSDVLRYFASAQNHRAVMLFKMMSPRGFNFTYPPATMLYLSNPPDLRVDRAFPADLIEHAGGRENLD